ncbi:MAG: DUF1598 domain-containing protein [Planctomycetota bacterium]
MKNCCRLRRLSVRMGVALLVVGLVPVGARAQVDDGDIIGGGLNTVGDQAAGVYIDARGVLKRRVVPSPPGELKRIAARARRTLSPDLSRWSDLRKISLNRLEKAVAARIADGEPLTDEMRYLAGLLRVQNVFFYPETGDIVLAGPAEGFAEDPAERVRGLSTGRPVLQLQDLATALRAYPPSGSKLSQISVSIDPTEEGLARLQKFLGQYRTMPRNPKAFAAAMRNQLGLQTVSVNGVSPKTHFAQVLVESDYRMKLIGIGLEKPAVDIDTFIEAAKPGSLAGNSLVRWYFVPNYECVRVSEDGLGMQMEGWGVKLIGAHELVRQSGGRVEGAEQSRASKAFCHSFTEQYPKLANRSPVYAELRNLIDLSVAAAFIHQQDYYGQASWDLGALGDETRYSVETYAVPEHVESAVNVVFKGNALMTPIGGGVDIQPLRALKRENQLPDDDGEVAATKKRLDLGSLPEGQWWWD